MTSQSRGGNGSTGQFKEREILPSQSFCNSFWSKADQRALPGSESAELGKAGYETLLGRMRDGSRTLEELRLMFKDRALFEDEYARKLINQSKLPLGPNEIGKLVRSFQQITAELETSSQSHQDLASLMKQLEAQVRDFITKRDNGRRGQQAAIEKAWKNKVAHESAVNKARTKYEGDCMSINTLNAQAAVSQGKEFDKIATKLDKFKQTVIMNQKDYAKYLSVLHETYATWALTWKGYCDICQDQEEERLEFIKNKLWDYSNAFSTVAVAADESAERIRVALEQVIPVKELVHFVEQAGSGNDVPDPPQYVDYSQKHPTLKRSFHKADFVRTSTRIGVTTSPSSMQEISKSFRNSASTTKLSAQAAGLSISDPRNGNDDVMPSGYSSQAMTSGSSRHSSTSDSRPTSLATSPKKANGLSALENAISSPRSSPSTSERKPSFDSNTPTRSNPDPSRFDIHSSSRSRQQSTDLSAPNSRTNTYSSGESYQRESKASSSKSIPDDDDPLSRALSKFPTDAARVRSRSKSRHLSNGDLSSMQQPESNQYDPRRQVRSSVTEGNLRAMGNGSNDYSQPPQQQSRPTNRGRSPSPAPPQEPRRRQRSVSPLPSASMMAPPPPNQVPAVVGSYGQAFPGERRGSVGKQEDDPRSVPSNRYSNGNNLASPAVIDPYPRSASPTPFAGVGARGRSPSPQPYIPRAPSPNLVNGRPGSYVSSPYAASSADSRIGSPYRPPSQGSILSQPRQPYSQPPQQLQYQHPATANPHHSMSFPSGAPPPIDSRSSYSSQPPPPQQVQPSQQRYSAPPSQYQPPPPPNNNNQAYGGYQPSPSDRNLTGYQSMPDPNIRTSTSHSDGSVYSQAPSHSQPQHHQQQQQQQYSPSVAVQQQQHQSQQAAYYQRQRQQQQASSQPIQQRAPSPVPTPPMAMNPPPVSGGTGKYSDLGRPIMFYVKALYDYEAPGPEYLPFNTNDVIAVTATAPDGWWQGERVGKPTRGGTTFPSNFTEIMR